MLRSLLAGVRVAALEGKNPKHKGIADGPKKKDRLLEHEQEWPQKVRGWKKSGGKIVLGGIRGGREAKLRGPSAWGGSRRQKKKKKKKKNPCGGGEGFCERKTRKSLKRVVS